MATAQQRGPLLVLPSWYDVRRAAVKAYFDVLRERQASADQTWVAEQVGTSRSYCNKVLNGAAYSLPMLEALEALRDGIEGCVIALPEAPE